ncbi:MAG TPA: threonine synthase [Thermodesulfobacteriota bacterium]|nr:threonine synthase [Thermodesulfobacteriota bacterium]
MEYLSTRGSPLAISSKKAIIKGIAEDSGLYVPSHFPRLGAEVLKSSEQDSYVSRAAKILRSFLTDFSPDELDAACRKAYSDNFDTPRVAPIQFLGEDIGILELWHGPTLAFKDMALQLMPWLLRTAILSEKDPSKMVILVATSGDTGKAALEGFADVEGVSLFVFYPHEGISEIQRLQMVTQRGSNVGVCGVRGNFDDAQSGVKHIFSEPEINARLERSHFQFSSANSINWGRLAPQIVYYFSAYEEMIVAKKVKRGQPIDVCVPTGNFGNILAAYYAFKCGLPVSKLICASNINKVLTDFIRSGIYDRRREFYKTESPSMDILISSNLERLLFELADRKPGPVLDWMNQLATQGWYQISRDALDRLQSLFHGGFADRRETSKSIKEAFEKYGYLLDPHSAVGYSVLEKYREETGDKTPTVLASTASPFKFNRAVLEAIGRDTSRRDEFALLQELSSIIGQAVPEKLAELKSLPEIHRGVCEKEGMAEVVLKFLGLD